MGARYIMTILFSSTYCLVILGCTVALLIGYMAVETFIAVLGAFALVVREIASSYFSRTDRGQDAAKPAV